MKEGPSSIGSGHELDGRRRSTAPVSSGPGLVVSELAASGLDALECNVSCPNTADGRLFSDDPDRLGELVSAVRSAIGATPLLVKLPLDFEQASRAAKAAVAFATSGDTSASAAMRTIT